MPYKAKNMEFGANKHVLDTDMLRDCTENLVLALDLKRRPVGVRLINEQAEYDGLSAPEVKGKMAYCQMIERAGKGRTYKSRLENHSCDGATTALALEKSTPRIESGEEYYSYNLYATKGAARRMRASITSLPWQDVATYGVLTGPLAEFTVQPDLVMVFATPYVAMRLLQGYEYATGVKPQIDLGSMQAVCSELTTGPLLRGDLNVSVLCPSTRMLAKWGEDEMGVSLPFERFYQLVDGVFGTMTTTDNKQRKLAAIKRFEKAGKTLDIDPNAGY